MGVVKSPPFLSLSKGVVVVVALLFVSFSFLRLVKTVFFFSLFFSFTATIVGDGELERNLPSNLSSPQCKRKRRHGKQGRLKDGIIKTSFLKEEEKKKKDIVTPPRSACCTKHQKQTWEGRKKTVAVFDFNCRPTAAGRPKA